MWLATHDPADYVHPTPSVHEDEPELDLPEGYKPKWVMANVKPPVEDDWK